MAEKKKPIAATHKFPAKPVKASKAGNKLRVGDMEIDAGPGVTFDGKTVHIDLGIDISPTHSKNKIRNKETKTEARSGQELQVPIEKYTPKGRKLRKAFERPRPDLPAYANANRTRRAVSITLPPDLLETVNERCRELDVDRTAFIEAAIRLALKPS